jgi:hypothetical protein
MTTGTSRRTFVVLLATLGAFDLLIAGLRLADTLEYGRLVLLPAEGQGLYAIWKLRHGYPLYEWPTRAYFALTLYNFLFYKTYAWLFTIFRVSDAAVPIAGRFVTLTFAACGAWGQYAATRLLVPEARRTPSAMLAMVTCVGCAVPGWWAFQIRPDVPAAACGTWGMVAVLRACGGGRRRWLLVAGVAFAIAWAFKQSQVALLSASCVYVLFWRRSIRGALLVAVPFVAVVSLAFFVGGGVYRANIVDAPSLNPLIGYLTLYWYRSVFLVDLLLWAGALYAIVALVRPGSVRGPLRRLEDVPERSRLLFGVDITYPVLTTVVAGAASAVLLAKVGSALNHILELNVAASLTTAVILGAAPRTARARPVYAAAAWAIVPMLLVRAALMQNDQGTAATALQLKAWSTPMHIASADTIASRHQLEQAFRSLPRPVFTDDELFAQPRYATNDRYPAIVLDHVFYDIAAAKGLVGRGVAGLFAERYFGSAVLPVTSAFFVPAMHAGYRVAGVVPQAGGEPLRILVRDP